MLASHPIFYMNSTISTIILKNYYMYSVYKYDKEGINDNVNYNYH